MFENWPLILNIIRTNLIVVQIKFKYFVKTDTNDKKWKYPDLASVRLSVPHSDNILNPSFDSLLDISEDEICRVTATWM